MIIETNILGTFILLKSSLDYYNNLNQNEKNIFRFLHISTDSSSERQMLKISVVKNK